ncbi:glycosyl transferase [Mycolicibacterium psychrotolerans]|uniref:Glycosyl transferase n=1 Tax=Mycolicibacterium psychrotolerans TaxID=216929 RepID=A0A7I7MFF0_9MYCO|nr:glycosyl transferase [Mycolicibacterium psychrotolerans]
MPSLQVPRNVLIWHVHGSWTESFVAGRHRYLIPVDEHRDADGRGLAGRQWPQAREVRVEDLPGTDVDLVVLQRPADIDLATRLLGRRPGTDVAAVYVEHNAPRPYAVDSVHPLADRSDIPLVHVTEFNELMWDSGAAPTRVIGHGVADRGSRYTGEIAAAAAMINEPVRRWRTVGADLLAPLSRHAPIDVWGMGTEELNTDPRCAGTVSGRGDISGAAVLDEVARRRVYLHTARWTSLGLSLLEAMCAGMPVVAVASTMAPLAVPPDAGVVSADRRVLGEALARFVSDPAAAEVAGKAAREHALAHFGLDRFLADWDRLIEEVCE